MQRLLTSGEELDFLSRHPLEAARVAETKAFLWTVGYDQILTPPSWYEFDVNIGLIPPSGDDMDDSVYGRVIVFPAPNGTIYFNGFVPEGYQPPGGPQYPGTPGAPTGGPLPEECDWLCRAQQVVQSVWGLVAIGFLVWVGSKR